jgi:hypothetical protein
MTDHGSSTKLPAATPCERTDANAPIPPDWCSARDQSMEDAGHRAFEKLQQRIEAGELSEIEKRMLGRAD